MTQDGGARETIFTMEATPVKYGPGASEELGWEAKRLGLKRIMLVSDPGVVKAGIAGRMRGLLEAEGIEVGVWDRSAVEPTSDSFQEAADFAGEGDFDGFVAVGGGSSMDTAKVANLILTHGGEILDYVNPPIGGGKKPPGPLKALICVPTTAGTGSEATTAAILDIPDLKLKTGISHAYLRPSRGIVDPLLTRTAPAAVTSSAGLDVVCHAAESYLSKPYNERPKVEDPDERSPYQGSNPVADIWSAKALEYGGKYLRRAVEDGEDTEARGFMMLGATLAGIGFGSAGVHIPHACAYPIAGLKHSWTPTGYPTDHAFVPHGWSVVVTAPAAFRFTYGAMPERHHEVANLLAGRKIETPDGDTLPDVLVELMRAVGAPSGVRELGYSEDDIPGIVDGALKQQRLLVGSPREATERDIAGIVRDSLENW